MNQQSASGIRFTSYLDPLTAPADIHEIRNQPVGPAEITSTIILSLVVGIGDLILIWLASEGTLPAALALIIHVAAVGLLWVFNRVKSLSGVDVRISAISLLTMLFTGPVGALGAIIMVVANLIYRSDALTFREWFNFIYPRPTSSLGEALYDGISLNSDDHARRYDVVPFMDIMRLGTAEQKREAINQMVLHFKPHFAPVFQMALKDPVLSVRTLAATSMARLEKHLQAQDRRLKAALEHGDQSPELLLAAAQFYDDYAFSGILDNERKQRYVKLAYDFYQRYLRRRSGDSRASVWIGRLLIRSGQNERAADWLKQMIDEGRSDAHILGWYAEVLYNIGDYNMLRRFMRDYAVKLQGLLHEERYSPLASSIQLWLNRSMEGRA